MHAPQPSIAQTVTPAVQDVSEEKTRSYRRRYLGPIRDKQLSEISGMAVSRRDDQLLWAINDSGQAASLYAMDTRGNLLSVVETQIQNRDWESLTSLTLNNTPYLLLGDSGDNLGIHKNYRLHLFEEPALGNASVGPVEPVATTTFTYADGKHNSEALAWSAADNSVLLITKHATDAAVYKIALAVSANQHPELIAQRIGGLARPPQSVSDELISSLAGVEMSQVTGFEIDTESRNAYVLTYRGVYQYRRNLISNEHNGSAGRWEEWSKTFSRTPRLLSRHTLSQAEALAIAPTTGTLYYTSEKLPAPLWKLEPLR